MKPLEESNLNDIKFFYRPETFDPALGYTWDADIFLEVVWSDAYRLKPLKEAGIGIRSILDIGSNIGAFPLFAKKLWPDAKIICVEPYAPNFELLKKNCENLKDITFIQKAIVGSKSHSSKVRFQPPAVARPNTNNNGGDGMLKDDGEIEVDACGLVDILPEEGIDLIKLDCEGAELDILKEAKEMGLFKKIRIMRGETHTLDIERQVRDFLMSDYWYSVHLKGVLGTFSADSIRPHLS